MRGGSGSGSAGVGRYPDAVIIVFGLVGLALVVVIGLVLVGRETARLAGSARPAVFDMEQAVDFIAERISPEAQGRLSHEDVRWILLADADLLEEASVEPEARFPWSRPVAVAGRPLDLVSGADQAPDPDAVVDQDVAVARILQAADAAARDVDDADVAEVLEQRLAYLERIGAVGGRVDDPTPDPGASPATSED